MLLKEIGDVLALGEVEAMIDKLRLWHGER
jgi:hypothetical protein